MRDESHPTKPGKRERKGSAVKDRKVGMENKESRRRMGTAERKAPSSSSRLSSVRDGRGEGEEKWHETLPQEKNGNISL